MKKKHIFNSLLLSFGFGIGFIAFGQISNDIEFNTNNQVLQLNNTKDIPQEIHSPPVPTKLSFAGMSIPLERTDVKENLERELINNTFRHSRTLLVLKKMGRWEKQIKAILKEEGVPEDFFYLAVAESELDNTAYSPVGASGMWQFMKGTAKDYNLVVDGYVDQRRDPILATKAACSFLKDMYKKFNDWGLVMAAYNRGPNGIQKKIKHQKVNSYFDLNLNKETSRYVYRILAFKTILTYPEKYGFFLNTSDYYKPYQYKEITVNKNINDLVAFAKEQGINYHILRLHNPWLNNRSNYQLHTHHHTYTIKIPIQ